MKKLIILAFILNLFANENFATMKTCEKIELSRYTSLVSCHNIDYIIEYKYTDDNEKDNIKSITAISINDKKLIIKK